MRILILAATLAVLPLSAAAQTAAPSPTVRAMAAGYKALTVCSALNSAAEAAVGGTRTLASVEANELVGIYPELDALVREMPVEIKRQSVAVAWDETMPARVATHRPGKGCVIMPVGWIDDGSIWVATYHPRDGRAGFRGRLWRRR